MNRLLPPAAASLCFLLLAPGPAAADDTDVPAGVGLTKKDQEAGKGKEKKPRVPAWQVEGATVGKVFGALMMSAGSGWVSGKAYPDNPLTEKKGDGPDSGRGLHDSGTAARWHLAWIFPRGWLIGAYARMQLTRGSNDGEFSDNEYDAWLLGVRAGRIFYSKNSLDIFWFGGLGYGHMRHRCGNVTDPNAVPDEFTRRDLWPFTPRNKVDVYKKSGFVDINMGVLVIYHFTPVFSLVFEVNGDFLAPDVAFNIDVSGGLGLAFG